MSGAGLFSADQKHREKRSLRHRLYLILDGGVFDVATRLIHTLLIILVIMSVSAVALDTAPSLHADYGGFFAGIEAIAIAVFSLEYILRVWVAPESAAYSDKPAWAARFAYMRSVFAIIDLASVLPFYLAFFIPADFRILIILRLLRFFKLARYSPGMRSLVAALHSERKALGATAVIVLGVVLFMATAMHIAEHQAQPDKFGSIPSAMWWAVMTITTVGYGDVVPVTIAGKMIAALAALTGFMLLALPVGIVATAFTEEIHRREFVVTWSMIARVPLFARLNAAEIAEVMTYLRAQTVPANTIVVQRGEEARSMYFIASGEVQVNLSTGSLKLGEGQFFGEIALLRKTRRTATVRTLQPTKLLALDARDLQNLMNRNSEIHRRIEEVATARGDFSARQSGGDILEAEMRKPDRDA